MDPCKAVINYPSALQKLPAPDPELILPVIILVKVLDLFTVLQLKDRNGGQGNPGSREGKEYRSIKPVLRMIQKWNKGTVSSLLLQI